jgi:hypothetical protein
MSCLVREIATACSKPRNDDPVNVILNIVKNLLGSTTINPNTDFEILRFAQDDRESDEIATACSKPRNDGV